MTTKANHGTGAGGSKTNETGLAFEQKVYLKEWLSKSGYELEPIKAGNRSEYYKIVKDGKHIGYYGRQGQVYQALKAINKEHFSNERIKEVLSKKINPDGFIISLKPLRLTIFEKKWQQGSGSVDEKIQTAPFKLQMFEKLLRGSGVSAQYQYILSSWFKNKAYRNVKEYYKDNKKISVWTENENLSELDIDTFLK